jgi:hypothetical protein
MKSAGIARKFAPQIKISVSGKLFEGHLTYLEQLVQSAGECRLWPVLNLSQLEELDIAASTYLSDGENRDFGIVSCPSFVREWIDRERGQPAA